MFRGITQTDEKPAVQGGFDLGHKSGFYVGTWASNVSWISDLVPPRQRLREHGMGLLRRLQGEPARRFRLRPRRPLLLVPRRLQQRAGGYTKPNTTELYAALTWKFLSLKYSWSANNQTFGVPDSRGSSYLDLTASYDVIDKVNDAIGKVTLFGHLGHQWYTGNPGGFANGDYDYGDWKVGASTEVYGVTVGIYGTGTNAQDQRYTNVYGKNTRADQFVGFIQKTF